MAVDKNKISAEAIKLVQKGQFDKAIRAYQKILASDPGDVRVLLKIGELQQKKGDIAGAADTFGRVAEAFAAQGFFLKAIAVYKQMGKLAPDDVRVNERLSALYQQLGLVSESLTQMQLIAAAAESARDDAKLLEVLRRIVELDPDNVGSAIKLGDVHVRKSESKAALAQFRRAAEVLKRNSRVDEYLKVAERIATLAPDDMGVAREVASMLLARGDAKRALVKLQACFKADPKDLETLDLLARAFTDLGQSSKVASVYREFAKLHEENGRVDAAGEAWRKVLELVPDDVQARAALQPGAPPPPAVIVPPPPITAPSVLVPDPPPAVIVAPEVARESVPEAVAEPSPIAPAADAKSISKLLGETDVYAKYALHDKALEHLEKVFAIDPDHLDAREKASRMRELGGDTAGAAEESIKAVRAALEQGLQDRAATALERARSLAPDHPDLASLAAALPARAAAADQDDGVVLDIEPFDEPAQTGAPGPSSDDLAIAAALSGGDEVVDGESPQEPALCPAPPLVDVVAPGAPATTATAPAEAPEALQEELAEIDFFIGQELLDDARELLDALAASHPDHAGIATRLERIELRRRAAAPSRAGSGEPRTIGGAPANEAIDRAAGSGDGDTHYDVGIAYREMGLLEPALREFELALSAASTAREIDCLAMIGLCRLDMGDPAGAADAYRRALRNPALTADARRELHYQLAIACDAGGDRETAVWYLNRVVESDAMYRDAQRILVRLGGGPGRRPAEDPSDGPSEQPAPQGEPEVSAGVPLTHLGSA